MIWRIGDKIDSSIPITQVAYRRGRSTTEQLFALKIMAEKAVTSKNFSTQILMMDMSKAFDTIKRGQLLKDLKAVLNPGELHIIKVLIEEVKLLVRIENVYGETITTNTGTPQGDCLSPVLFTLYLARALKDAESKPGVPLELTDHGYSETTDLGIMFDLQYADDICWVGPNCHHGIDKQKNTIPAILSARDLKINNSKTEEYNITAANNEWKKCKYLGSLLDSTEEIKRRKTLTVAALNKLHVIFKDYIQRGSSCKSS